MRIVNPTLSSLLVWVFEFNNSGHKLTNMANDVIVSPRQKVIYDQLLRFDRVWTLVGRTENIAESIILLREARIFRLTREINGNSATWQVRVFPYL